MAFDDLARPGWQHTPCPAWCVRVHTESDADEDRCHESVGVAVPLVMLVDEPMTEGTALARTPEATEFVIHAMAHLDDSDTWVYVGEAEGSRQRIRVSFESAKRLIAALQRHLDVL